MTFPTSAQNEKSWDTNRVLLALVILLCVGLPRAGVVITGLPLPFSLPLLHLIFWPFIFPRLSQTQDITQKIWRIIGYFTLTVLLAALLGVVRGASPRLILIEIVTLIGQVPAFFVVVYLLRNDQDIKTALYFLSISLLGTSAYGIMQFYLGTSIIIPGITYTAGSNYSLVNLEYAQQARKILSTYGDPNVFAAALVLFIPGLVGAFLEGRRHGVKWSHYFFYGLASATALIALIFCDSRAGYAGIMISLSLLGVRFAPILLRALPIIVLVFFLFGQISITERIFNWRSFDDSDDRYRYDRVALDLMIQHPEGAGLGIYPYTNPRNNSYVLFPAASVWHTYNSFYLHLLSRVGVLGLICFLWVSLSCALHSWQFCKIIQGRSPWRPTIVGFLCGFVGSQIALMFNPVYLLPAGGINFWIALGLAFGIGRIATQKVIWESLHSAPQYLEGSS